MTRETNQPPITADIPSEPPAAGTAVWLYARSATSPAAIDDQHHHLAATAARHRLVVAGRSGDLGADPAPPRHLRGWDAALTAVTEGHAADVVVHDLDRLGRRPGAVALRVGALHAAGGRLWVTDPAGTLRPVNPATAASLGDAGPGPRRARPR